MILSHDFPLLHTHTHTPSGSVDTKRRRKKRSKRTNQTEQTRIENNGVNATCVSCSINTVWRKMRCNFALTCWRRCRNRRPESTSTKTKPRVVCERRRMNHIFFSVFEIISFALKRRKQTVGTIACVSRDEKNEYRSIDSAHQMHISWSDSIRVNHSIFSFFSFYLAFICWYLLIEYSIAHMTITHRHDNVIAVSNMAVIGGGYYSSWVPSENKQCAVHVHVHADSHNEIY